MMFFRFAWQDRGLRVLALVVLSLLGSCLQGLAVDIEIPREPPPSWVEPLPVDVHAKSSQNSGDGGIWYLLADMQTDVASQTRYYHYAYRFLSESGVQEYSERSFAFDPRYQKLVLHRLQIHRDGKVIDRLLDQSIKTLERESGYEEQLYDGKLTSVALLKDIRVGDVLDYAYSIEGRNPIFAGHFSTTQQWSWGSTLHRARYRLLWDKEEELSFRMENSDAEPVVTARGKGQEYVWEQWDSKPVHEESGVPGDYSAYSWIELSDYRSWDEVRTWARALYHYPEVFPAELQQHMEMIRLLPNDEQKVLAALGFVQDNIRYVGSFMGEHSHKPYDLDTIMSRRFGDCKDKTLILVAVLRQLGLQAAPALLDTDFRGKIVDWLPSPFAFDHVVTRLELGGKVYWLDPTRSFQRGDSLDKIYFPDYRKALVLDDSKGGLEEIKSPGFLGAKTELEEVFTFDDYKGGARLQVVTDYYGRDADQIRAYFSRSGEESIKQDYIEYYANDYSSIEIVGTIKSEDDEGANHFKVSENYQINDFWEKNDGGEYWGGTFFPRMLNNELYSPTRKNRKMPYGISHFRDVTHKLKIVLPSKWEDEVSESDVDNPAFTFDYAVEAEGNVTEISYRYVSKKDTVPTKDVTAYVEAIDKVKDVMGYEITIPESYRALAEQDLSVEVNLDENTEEEDYQPNWLAIIIALGALFVGLLASVGFYFWNPAAVPPGLASKLGDKELFGLGGWLVVVALGLFIRLLLRAVSLIGDFGDLDLSVWNNVTTAGNEYYHWMWAPAILGKVIWDLFVLPLELLQIVLYFQKRTSFPKLLMVEMFFLVVQAAVFGVVYQSLPGIEEGATEESLGNFRSALIAACIWIPYLLVSKRVRNTFVERRGRQVTPPPLIVSATV